MSLCFRFVIMFAVVNVSIGFVLGYALSVPELKGPAYIVLVPSWLVMNALAFFALSDFFSLDEWLKKSADAECTVIQDVIFDWIDDRLLEGQYDDVDRFLCRWSGLAERMPTKMVLNILTATSQAKDKLPHRRRFFKAAKSGIESRGEMQENLLSGLE